MEPLAARMERGERPRPAAAGTTQLTAAFEAGGGYDTDTAEEQGVQRPVRFRPGHAGTALRPALRRGEDPGEPGPADPGGHRHPAAGRAHQPPGPPGHRVAGGVSATRSRARCWPSPTTAGSWTGWCTGSSRSRRGRRSFTRGNYSFYVVEKERRYQEKLKQYEKEQAKIAAAGEGGRAAADLGLFMGNDKIYKPGPSPWKSASSGCGPPTSPPRSGRWTSASGSAEFRGDEVLTIKELSKSFGGRTSLTGVRPGGGGGRAHRPAWATTAPASPPSSRF